ncbi:MAG: class I SAM-dependent methyltransferase [Proteobacteria bacterium]|nr:class I SAM-dependent methyltransferase [Pseudomonadota bacterium]
MTHNRFKMSTNNWLRDLLGDPAAKGIDLDSKEATELHARLIREKVFLKKLYQRYYREFQMVHEDSPPGLRLEIGAGGGFLKELIPRVVTFDIRPAADVDATASAMKMPLEDESVGAIFMLNVLHHLSDADLFFSEATRVLCPGGRAVFIEPYVSPFSNLVYKNLHHEPFNPKSPNWALTTSGPMSSANGALPWIIFVRDRARFEAEFPELEICRVTPHTVLLYLLSGGVSMRCLLPSAAFEPLAGLEQLLGPAIRHVATMMTVEIRSKKKG